MLAAAVAVALVKVAAVVVSASLEKAQTVLAGFGTPLAAAAALVVPPVEQELPVVPVVKMAVLMAAAAAVEQALPVVEVVLVAQSASYIPVQRAHSHRLIQGTYKWQLFQASFLR